MKENTSWNNLDNYLQWLYGALEHLKHSKFVYDKKGRKLYYNKAYWEFRFKMEIKRVERVVLLQHRIDDELQMAG